MAATTCHSSSSDIKNYPFLTPDEFAEACHQLDRRYIQAALGPVRRRWRLRVCRAFDMALASSSSSSSAEHLTYLQIIQPLDDGLDDGGGLSVDLANFSFDNEDKGGSKGVPVLGTEDQEMMEAEEADTSATVQKKPSPPDFGYVTYEVHLHPTYQAPCLWFSLHNLPAGEPAFSIDTVFRRLVPDQYKDGLRKVGGMGGISADHHPVTGFPSFFVHPCLLGGQMANWDCSKENYLMVWLGLVGGCVGLWVPKEMAVD